MSLPSNLANLLDYARSEAKRASHGTVEPVHVAAALLRQDAGRFVADFGPGTEVVVRDVLGGIARSVGRIVDGDDTTTLLERVAASGGSRDALVSELKNEIPGLRAAVPQADVADEHTESEAVPEQADTEVEENVTVAPMQERTIRVFVSSTFRDMHAEREELVKRVFPQLRKLCGERGVTWGEVDLRWGITDEQKAEGQVLPICLAEIEKSRPYFIGLLGERYGWVPDGVEQGLTEREPWLKDHEGQSVTELEMLHGVLNDPEMAEHAFFYFRDREASAQVEAQLAAQPGYRPEPGTSKARLAALKQRIVASGFPVYRDYPDPGAFGARVLADLTAVIDRRFPAGAEADPLDRDALDHAAFARSRAQVYIGRQAYYDRLDDYVAGDAPAVVLLGESGTGKSALLANWALRYEEKHPDDFVFTHFIGSTQQSSDHIALIRRLIGEIRRRFDVGEEIPDSPEALCQALPGWLAIAASSGRAIVILDALNQLEDKGNAPELGWLPVHYPQNLRLIVSTLPGRSLDSVIRRGWGTFRVDKLEKNERCRIIREYLWQFRKRLPDRQVERIAVSEQAENPLYLRALLEELRVYGEHESLDERIDYYLGAPTIDALYQLILERLEQDYEQDHEGLVSAVLSVLWAARRGVSELELLEMLEIPHAAWSPLHIAMDELIQSRSGLLSFSHDYVRSAVTKRYLPGKQEQISAHLGIAGYFSGRPADRHRADELPWQYLQAGELARLKDCICEPAMFAILNENESRYDLLGYWLQLKEDFDVVEELGGMIDRFRAGDRDATEIAGLLHGVAVFMTAIARYGEGEKLFREALDIRVQHFGREHGLSIESASSLAQLLYYRGDYSAAEPIYRFVLDTRSARDGEDHPGTAGAMSALARLYDHTGRYRESEQLARKALATQEKIYGKEHTACAAAMVTLAYALRHQGNFDDAEELNLEAVEIYKNRLGISHPDTAASINILSRFYYHKGNYDRAEQLCRQVIDLRRKILGPEHPETAKSIHHLAVLLYHGGDFAGAEKYYRIASEIRERVLGRKHPDTADSVHDLAVLMQAKGDYDSALRLFGEALDMYEMSMGKAHPFVATCLQNMVYLHQAIGDNTDLVPLARKVVDIRASQLGEGHEDTLRSLEMLAELQRGKDLTEDAVRSCKRAYELRKQYSGEYNQKTLTALNELVSLLVRSNDIQLADSMSNMAVDLCARYLGPVAPGNAVALHNRAILLNRAGMYSFAKKLLRDALKILDMSVQSSAPFLLEVQSSLADATGGEGDVNAACKLYRKILAAREEIYGGDHAGIADTWFGMAEVCRKQNAHGKAAEFYSKALEIYENRPAETDLVTRETLGRMAVAHNELAFHTDVPGENWSAAEAHYTRAIELLARIPDEKESLNMELNLQIMYKLSGGPFDIDRVRELTDMMAANEDPRAEKGRKLLEAH
ncbi:MAG: tetratricopeptide repeat protein [Thiogranum sp.]